MASKDWEAVDDYFEDLLISADPVLETALQDSDAAGLPPHHVTPNQGKLLHLLIQIQGARRVLEIGTLGGYSTIWLARALPTDGYLVTLEANPHHAEVARSNLARANLLDTVDLRVGNALNLLPDLQPAAPFDFIFIDADKPNNPHYLAWALQLSGPGTVIIGDNVVRDGEVANAHSSDPKVQGVRTFCELLAAPPQVSATAIQTVGSKGYDGFAIARVTH
ncbi:O-methyltransferase [Acaryochloris marina]|uniref:O-methyltransferase n=1 Tax=Acaryochloris marina TaxID=155978 RepID=UPI001BAE8084|nr:O-methyltransferase [Acaryochloris marina]QUY42123.1 O-methyltransferase [Acaryochloris marina S15]